MQPNEITLANMAQLAKANATNQDPQLQSSTTNMQTPGMQAPGVPLKGVIGATAVNPSPTAAGPAATPTPNTGIIAGQMMVGKRA
jgi:hypothetical protein